MDIIRALKAYAHHEIHCKIIKKIDDSVKGKTKKANEIANEIFVLDAMYILATLWAKVTAKCIQNCWVKAKSKTEVQDRAVEDAENVDMPPAPAEMTENDFLQWVDIDNDVEIATGETIQVFCQWKSSILLMDKFVIFCKKILFSGTLPSFLHLKLTNVRA